MARETQGIIRRRGARALDARTMTTARASASTTALIAAAKRLRDRVARMRFAPPVAYVYNPLQYAWQPHEMYLHKYGRAPKRVIFMGINPGPYGMTQTGVPFGEIAAVRDWLEIEAPVQHPPKEHPKRPVEGFACRRSEVSGRRLWGFFKAQYKTPQAFFEHHFVVNYCPLVFMEESGLNRTPDKLPAGERGALLAACDEHLREVAEILRIEWAIGIGGFAEKRLQETLAGMPVRIGRIPHPSPANPSANRDWAAPVRQILDGYGLL